MCHFIGPRDREVPGAADGALARVTESTFMGTDDIRSMRRRLGLTQSELADALGVDQASVSRWERAADAPRPHRLAQIRDLLLRDDRERARRRQIAIVEHNLHPATIVDERMRLVRMSNRALVHFATTRGVDASGDVGRHLGFHGETVSNSEFCSHFLDGRLRPHEIVMGRILVNLRGLGSICEVEPIFRDARFAGLVYYQSGTCEAPPFDGFRVERTEILTLDDPSGFTTVFTRPDGAAAFP